MSNVTTVTLDRGALRVFYDDALTQINKTRNGILTTEFYARTGDAVFEGKRYELPRPPGGYDRVLKRVGIQYCRISSTTAGMSL